MEMDCLLVYDGPGYFPASLAEPISCVIGAFNASYHTEPGKYVHKMGIVEGGNLALLAGAGPMGLADPSFKNAYFNRGNCYQKAAILCPRCALY